MPLQTVKHIPMPFPNESDDAYEARLKAMGITDADFDDAFNDEMPLSNSDVTTAVFHNGDPQGDEGKAEFSK
jgi:hypothetical protein